MTRREFDGRPRVAAMGPLTVVAAVLLSGVTLGCTLGCSGSDAPDDDPGIDRIDGPAQVDPSYDPFAVAPTSEP